VTKSPKRPPKPKRSRNALSGKIYEIRRGLSIYKVGASPYYRARMWSASQGRYLVKSTKEKMKAAAIEAAEAMFENLRTKRVIGAVPKSHTFETFAEKLIERQAEMAAHGEIHREHAKNDEYILRLNGTGLIAYFGRRDVTTFKPSEITSYLSWLKAKRGRKLASSTLNKYVNVYRKTLRVAVEEGVLTSLPAIAQVPRDDNPRPFFRFEPLVPTELDEIAKLLTTAERLAEEGATVRGLAITRELRDFIEFMLGSFLRPTLGEIFSLRHRRVAIVKDPPRRLLLRVPASKTGYREVTTLQSCVDVYERIRQRAQDAGPDDYLFLPGYPNRETANRRLQDQFNFLLGRTGLKVDPDTGLSHTVYSLRHTAICMRLIRSERQVNVLTLARTAGTSVDQIERFYARRLPISPELAKNLQISPSMIARRFQATQAPQPPKRLVAQPVETPTDVLIPALVIDVPGIVTKSKK
jgi:hypothetical protein